MGLAYNPKLIGSAGRLVEVLYCVPVNSESNAAVADGVLSGQTAISSSTTPANGVSALSRPFIPVNGPDKGDGTVPEHGMDYGDQAANLAAQRAQCLRLQNRDQNNDGTLDNIALTVYANT